MDEKELIRQAAKGSEEAFAVLVKKYRTKMFNLAYSMIRNRETADDIAQDVFIKAYIYISKFKYKSSFGTWLYRIAVNTVKDYLRKESRINKISFDERLASPDIPDIQEDGVVIKEEELEAKLRKKLLHRAIQALPEKHRTILTLRDIQGISYKEITGILNISPGTVDSRLYRARRMLRKKVACLPSQKGGRHEM